VNHFIVGLYRATQSDGKRIGVGQRTCRGRFWGAPDKVMEKTFQCGTGVTAKIVKKDRRGKDPT